MTSSANYQICVFVPCLEVGKQADGIHSTSSCDGQLDRGGDTTKEE